MTSEASPKFSSLIDLFGSINVVEKGIEQVYDFLLKEKTVEDLKVLVDELGLNLKRVYKICSVLKDLGLVQIYYRPMKIQLLNPITSWETLIHSKITEINNEANEKEQKCYNSFDQMVNSYNLEKIKQQPVEFISFLGSVDLESELYSILSNNDILIAHGIWYNYNYDRIMEFLSKNEEDLSHFSNILSSIPETKINVLISDEYLEAFKDSKIMQKYNKLNEIFNDVLSGELKIDIRITPQSFSSFIVKDNSTLLQPSFDPNDNLLGYFISQHQEIVEIFADKFNTLFDGAKPIETSLKFNPESKKLNYFLLSL